MLAAGAEAHRCFHRRSSSSARRSVPGAFPALEYADRDGRFALAKHRDQMRRRTLETMFQSACTHNAMPEWARNKQSTKQPNGGPLWVRLRPRRTAGRCPVSPRKRTQSRPACTSRKCQKQTFRHIQRGTQIRALGLTGGSPLHGQRAAWRCLELTGPGTFAPIRLGLAGRGFPGFRPARHAVRSRSGRRTSRESEKVLMAPIRTDNQGVQTGYPQSEKLSSWRGKMKTR